MRNVRIDEIGRHLTQHFALLPRWKNELELQKQVEEIAALNRLSFQKAALMLGEGNLYLLKQLAARFTIDESFVLRHEEHFSVLRSKLERWRETEPRLTPIRIWCAGCAKGEEPYTAAALAFEVFETTARSRVRIMANDINPEAIRHARKGVFGPWSFRGVDETFRNRHFAQVENEKWSARDHLRDLVAFEHSAIQEVLAGAWSAPFDFVFFRNVAVYFDAQRLNQIYEGLRRALHPGGLLFIAPSDPIPPREILRPSGFADNPTVLSPVVERSVTKGGPFSSNPPPSFRVGLPPRPLRTDTRIDVLIRRADELGDAGRITDAIGAADAVIEASPDDKAGYVLRARLRLSNEEPGLAAADFEKALELDPRDDVVRYWYALSLHSMGNSGQCATELKHILENLGRLNPNDLLPDNATTATELRSAVERLHEVLA